MPPTTTAPGPVDLLVDAPSTDPAATSHVPRPSRRTLLIGAGAGLATVACAPTTGMTNGGPIGPAPTSTTTVPGGGALTPEMLVDKLTFGATAGLAAHIRSRGIGPWLDDQLDPDSAALDDAEDLLNFYTAKGRTHRQLWDLKSAIGSNELDAQMDMATVIRCVYSERQLFEQMCDFWSNHFNTWRGATWMRFLKPWEHENVVRAHALGKFSDMLQASAHSPAMLDYLDQASSSARNEGGVNENYARELLELHTLGIINGEHVYDESDVRGAAQLLSGWTIDWSDTPNKYGYYFNSWAHSHEPVSVLGGAFSRPARPDGQGYDDGVAFLDMLAHHPSTARYISLKLCRKFVSDTPSDALVNSTAAVFTANDTEIAPTVRHIITSSEFASSHRQKVRRPFEHLVGCLRAMDAEIPSSSDSHSGDRIRAALHTLGQPIFERRSPDGYPDEAAYWLSSEGLLQRWGFAADVARNRVTSSSKDSEVTVDLRSLLPGSPPATVGELMRWIASQLANFELSVGDVANACAAYAISPTDASGPIVADDELLAEVFALVFSHPTFQLR